MLEIGLLMLFGKFSESGGKIWQWAMGFAVISTIVFAGISGLGLLLMVIRFGIAFAYFTLLNQFSDRLVSYFIIFILFPISLLLLNL